MTDILNTNDIDKLRKLAKSMGIKIHNFDTTDKIKVKIKNQLGDLGFDDLADTSASDDAKKRAKEGAIKQILSGRAELGGISEFPKALPKGKLPNLLPFQNPWGGRRRRVKRIRLSENDQQILFIHWNGYPFVLGLDADYADLPYPHFFVLLNATSERMRQKKKLDEEGRANWYNEFFEVKNFPIQDMGVTPGTEHLPRSMKEYLYSAYVDGFPGFTPIMWKQVAQAYNYSDRGLGITPTMKAPEQVAARRMAVMDRLGLVEYGDDAEARKQRAEVVAEILSISPIAEAA